MHNKSDDQMFLIEQTFDMKQTSKLIYITHLNKHVKFEVKIIVLKKV